MLVSVLWNVVNIYTMYYFWPMSFPVFLGVPSAFKITMSIYQLTKKKTPPSPPVAQPPYRGVVVIDEKCASKKKTFMSVLGQLDPPTLVVVLLSTSDNAEEIAEHITGLQRPGIKQLVANAATADWNMVPRGKSVLTIRFPISKDCTQNMHRSLVANTSASAVMGTTRARESTGFFDDFLAFGTQFDSDIFGQYRWDGKAPFMTRTACGFDPNQLIARGGRVLRDNTSVGYAGPADPLTIPGISMDWDTLCSRESGARGTARVLALVSIWDFYTRPLCIAAILLACIVDGPVAPRCLILVTSVLPDAAAALNRDYRTTAVLMNMVMPVRLASFLLCRRVAPVVHARRPNTARAADARHGREYENE
jgi:hypothetical protein